MSEKLLIHGHSCCEIRSSDTSIICDPWLLGSAYWRSWWNFPCTSNLDDLLAIWLTKKNLWIYITHLHWDHFHGPTLRKILKVCSNAKFIIPKTPEPRLFNDLKTIVDPKKIKELVHAKKYKLTTGLEILSFQSGPFLTDSAIAFITKKGTILNLNDSKPMGMSVNHLKKILPTPKYVLRSHSSANDRCCMRTKGNPNNEIFSNNDWDKSRKIYSREFFEACFKFNSKYAIPFASNMACLHKDTFEYNKIINFADYCTKDFERDNSFFKGMQCLLLSPSESIDIESGQILTNSKIKQELFSIDRPQHLKNIQDLHKEKLEKQYLIEGDTKLNKKFFASYFYRIIHSTPLILRLYLSDSIIFEIFNKNSTIYYLLDFKNKQIKELSMPLDFKNIPVRVRVPAYVINDVCKQNHYNSLGVSKRLLIWQDKNEKRYVVFNFLCVVIENFGFLPLKNIFKRRFFLVWSSRYLEIFDLIILSIKLIFNRKKKYYTNQ